MRVIIAGAGLSGSYLGRLLKNNPTLYDDNPKPGCGCAWGTPYIQVHNLLHEIGIDFADYVLCRVKGVYENKVFVPLDNFVVMDKPRLIQELRIGLDLINEKHGFKADDGDLIVNATSVPRGGSIFRLASHQEKAFIVGADEHTAYTYIHPRYIGYAWLFPLDEEGLRYHCGAAGIGIEPRSLVNLMLSYYDLQKEEVECNCNAPLYLADPRNVDLVRGNVVAVGGAAGCIHPITGEGILPSMETAKILSRTLNERAPLKDYAVSVRKLLGKYRDSYNTLYKMQVSPVWGWTTGLRKDIFKSIEHFDPRPRPMSKIRIIVNILAVYFSNSRVESS